MIIKFSARIIPTTPLNTVVKTEGCSNDEVDFREIFASSALADSLIIFRISVDTRSLAVPKAVGNEGGQECRGKSRSQDVQSPARVARLSPAQPRPTSPAAGQTEQFHSESPRSPTEASFRS